MLVTRSLFIIVFLFLMKPVAFTQAKMPAFAFTTYQGKTFKATDLPKGKPLVLVYFLPDCGHCQDLTRELTASISRFSKASVAMLTCVPVDKVSAFVKDYNLSKYSNLYVGTELNTLFVRNFYRIDELPFVALYDKSGRLVKIYSRKDKLNDVATRLKALL